MPGRNLHPLFVEINDGNANSWTVEGRQYFTVLNSKSLTILFDYPLKLQSYFCSVEISAFAVKMNTILAILLLMLPCLCSSLTYVKHSFRTHDRSMIINDAGNDDVFGAEFKDTAPSYDNKIDSTKVGKVKRVDRGKVMQQYQNLRSTFLADSLLIAAIGFSVVWSLGTYKDALSFLIGSFLGLGYSVLLGRYVEKIGTGQSSKAGDALRFAPVIFMVALYGKFKEQFSLIPELAGFISSYQLASLLQIFNPDPYGEKNENSG